MSLSRPDSRTNLKRLGSTPKTRHLDPVGTMTTRVRSNRRVGSSPTVENAEPTIGQSGVSTASAGNADQTGRSVVSGEIEGLTGRSVASGGTGDPTGRSAVIGEIKNLVGPRRGGPPIGTVAKAPTGPNAFHTLITSKISIYFFSSSIDEG